MNGYWSKESNIWLEILNDQ